MLRWTDIYGNTTELFITDPGENVERPENRNDLIGIFSKLQMNDSILFCDDKLGTDYFSWLTWDSQTAGINLTFKKKSHPQKTAGFEAHLQFITNEIALFEFSNDGWNNSGRGQIKFNKKGTVTVTISLENNARSDFHVFVGQKTFNLGSINDIPFQD